MNMLLLCMLRLNVTLFPHFTLHKYLNKEADITIVNFYSNHDLLKWPLYVSKLQRQIQANKKKAHKIGTSGGSWRQMQPSRAKFHSFYTIE